MSHHCSLVTMTSNQHSFNEPHTCWLMSPGGTDSMQISNWKRITQIHHCISARTVTTVHNVHKEAEEDGGDVFALICVTLLEWDQWWSETPTWAPAWRTPSGWMVPMLHTLPASLLAHSFLLNPSFSLPKDLWFEYGRQLVTGDRNYCYWCAAKCSNQLMRTLPGCHLLCEHCCINSFSSR